MKLKFSEKLVKMNETVVAGSGNCPLITCVYVKSRIKKKSQPIYDYPNKIAATTSGVTSVTKKKNSVCEQSNRLVIDSLWLCTLCYTASLAWKIPDRVKMDTPNTKVKLKIYKKWADWSTKYVELIIYERQEKCCWISLKYSAIYNRYRLPLQQMKWDISLLLSKNCQLKTPEKNHWKLRTFCPKEPHMHKLSESALSISVCEDSCPQINTFWRPFSATNWSNFNRNNRRFYFLRRSILLYSWFYCVFYLPDK